MSDPRILAVDLVAWKKAASEAVILNAQLRTQRDAAVARAEKAEVERDWLYAHADDDVRARFRADVAKRAAR